MRLSDAIAMGRVTMDSWDPTSFCGCAIGAGLKAVGKTPMKTGIAATDSGLWQLEATKVWHWLLASVSTVPKEVLQTRAGWEGREIPPIHSISLLFYGVHDGTITLDQLIDWVRANEPSEPEEAVNQETYNEMLADVCS